MPKETRQQLAELAAVLKWSGLKRELDDAKAAEMKARLEAIAVVFGPNALKTHGTRNHELSDRAALKMEIRRFAKVDQKRIRAAITSLKNAAGDVGELLAERLVKWSASASIAELEKLPQDLRTIFENVISIELQSPSLELIDAK